MIELINKALAPARRAIANMVGRAVLQAIKDDAKMQELQISLLTDEVRQRAERFQNYGFTSVPLPGAEAVALFPGGDRSAPIVIVVDDRRYRKKNMKAGEVAVYNDKGDYVLFKDDRTIEVVAGTEVKVTAPTITANASTKVQITSPQVVVDASTSLTITSPTLTFNSDNINMTANVKVTMTAPTIEMVASTKVRAQTPLVEATSNVTASGTVTGTTNVVGGGKSLNSHVHTGVTAGGANTGAPL